MRLAELEVTFESATVDKNNQLRKIDEMMTSAKFTAQLKKCLVREEQRNKSIVGMLCWFYVLFYV